MNESRIDPRQNRELATMLGAASEQIGLALQDSHGAVETLGLSLERLMTLLSPDSADGGEAAAVAAVRAELARAVTGLQFYDRMAQHLSHVRDYLDGTVEQLQTTGATFEVLNRKLADRLPSDTHRIHLGKDLQAQFLVRTGLPSAARSKQGDIDLF